MGPIQSWQHTKSLLVLLTFHPTTLSHSMANTSPPNTCPCPNNHGDVLQLNSPFVSLPPSFSPKTQFTAHFTCLIGIPHQAREDENEGTNLPWSHTQRSSAFSTPHAFTLPSPLMDRPKDSQYWTKTITSLASDLILP